jgi:hypothetical protein
MEAHAPVIYLAPKHRAEYRVVTHPHRQELRGSRQLGRTCFSDFDHPGSMEESGSPAALGFVIWDSGFAISDWGFATGSVNSFSRHATQRAGMPLVASVRRPHGHAATNM